MAVLKVNKIQAAQRQIDIAIRLLFENEDPLPIHTLIMAAFRILRDLASKKDKSRVDETFRSMIKPGTEKRFWKEIQSFSNFLKHADEDPEAVFEVPSEEVNDANLLVASLYYRELTGTMTPEIMAFLAWFGGIHPEIMFPDAPDIVKNHLEAASISFIDKPRNEQLAEGNAMLKMARLIEIKIR